MRITVRPWLMAAALTLALGLPVLSTDLPSLYCLDELSHVLGAFRVASGTLRPFGYTHGPLFPEAVALVFAIGYLPCRLAGLVSSAPDYFELYLLRPAPFLFAARAVSLLAAAGAAATAAILGTRLGGRAAGFWAGAIAGLSPAAQVVGTLAKEDTLAALLVGLSMAAVLPSPQEAAAGKRDTSPGRWFAAGAFLAAAAAAKYTAVVLGAGLLATVLLERKRLRALVALGAGGLAGLALAFPQLLFDLPTVRAGVTQIGAEFSGHESFPAILGFYLWSHLGDVLGILPAGLLLVALVALWREPRLAACWTAGPIALLAFFVTRAGFFPHHYVAALPLLAALTGWAVAALGGRVGGGAAGAAALCLVVLGEPAWTSMGLANLRLHTDARSLAEGWIEANVPAHARIFLEGSFEGVFASGPNLLRDERSLARWLAELRANGLPARNVEAELRVARSGRQSRPRYDLVDRPLGSDAGSGDWVVTRRFRLVALEGHPVVVSSWTPSAPFQERAEFIPDLAVSTWYPLAASVDYAAARHLGPLGRGTLRGVDIRVYGALPERP